MFTTPSIQEYYAEFVDTIGFRELVEEALASVPAKFVSGVERVVLRDVPSLTRTERRMRYKTDADRTKHGLTRAKGLYYAGNKSEGARIELFPDNILKERPAWVFRVPPFRVYLVTSVLFHEIGHHVQAAIYPSKTQKEGRADEWEAYLFRNFYLGRHKVLGLVATIYRWFAKRISGARHESKVKE